MSWTKKAATWPYAWSFLYMKDLKPPTLDAWEPMFYDPWAFDVRSNMGRLMQAIFAVKWYNKHPLGDPENPLKWLVFSNNCVSDCNLKVFSIN